MPCHIAGIFSLIHGSRQIESRHLAEYFSSIALCDRRFIGVTINKFSSPSEALLPDNSFVFIVAKATLKPGEEIILDTIFCAPFNPLSFMGSEDPVAFPSNTAFITGTLRAIGGNANRIRTFTLTTSEYVRGERHTFDVTFVLSLTSYSHPCLHTHISFTYDARTIRWRNIHLPAIGSFVIATGVFADVILINGDDHPVFDLLDISFRAANHP